MNSTIKKCGSVIKHNMFTQNQKTDTCIGTGRYKKEKEGDKMKALLLMISFAKLSLKNTFCIGVTKLIPLPCPASLADSKLPNRSTFNSLIVTLQHLSQLQFHIYFSTYLFSACLLCSTQNSPQCKDCYCFSLFCTTTAQN